MDFNKDFLLLQINDALFPIGGYSHSFGLETYIQKNIVTNGEKAKEYILSRINNSVKYTELLGIRLAYNEAEKENIEGLLNIDEILTASKIPSEIRTASLKMGSRFVKTIKNCQSYFVTDIFDKYLAQAKNIHHITAYAVVCASAKIPLNRALEGFLFAQCSGMVTNCVKTVPLSQSQGQKILSELFEVMGNVISDVLVADEEDFCASCPAFDIRSMEHQELYSRLYMS